MHAVEAGDGDGRLERGLVGDAVEPGAERLHPLELAGPFEPEVEVLHHLPEREQDVSLFDRRFRLVALRHHVDGEFGEQLAQPRTILLGNVGRQREEDQEAGHCKLVSVD